MDYVSLSIKTKEPVKYRHALLIIFIILLIDQVSKIYVKTHFYYGEEVRVIGNWFRWHFIENEGMAFGMKFGQAEIAKLALTIFRLVAVAFGFYFLKKLITKGYKKGLIVCGSLILAGALGNLIDSMFYGLIFTESSFHLAKMVPPGQGYAPLFYGRVVDMFYFPMVDTVLPEWVPFKGGERFVFFEPIFNVADIAISTGVITLLVFQKRFLPEQSKPQADGEKIAG